LSDNEYSIYYVNGESTSQSESYRLKQCASRTDDTLLHSTAGVAYGNDHVVHKYHDIHLLGAQM